MKTLFTLSIPPLPAHPKGGSITCTEPQPCVYVLAFDSPPDNRVTTPFCKALLTALDIIEFGPYKPGVVITTSAIPKFYSNGLDLEHAIATEGFWPLLYQMWKRFLTYPMPTLALMNGHAFAGGLMLATAHDYRLAPSPRGYLCLNELVFGAPLRPQMASLFRAKMPPATFRKLVLEAHRFTGDEAVAAGIADGLAPAGPGAASVLDAGLKFVADHALLEKPRSGIYGTLKAEMYKGLVAEMSGDTMQTELKRADDDMAADAERKEFGKVWYEQWTKEDKAKL